MGYDAVATGAAAAAACAAAAARDAAKKKRGNKSAKLKQCKMDARREQWLSQGKDSKDSNVVIKSGSGSLMLNSPSLQATMPCSQINRQDAVHFVGNGHGSSDFDSPGSSPTINNSHPLQRKHGMSSESSAWSSSRSVSDNEEDGGGCRDEDNGELDDWEAVADALSAESDHEQQQIGGPPVSNVPTYKHPGGHARTQPEPIRNNCRAWAPDDVFRPRSLPSISKQGSFQERMEVSWGGTGGGQKIPSLPPSCPICCEDLDVTDSSFLPCPCGFRLCLFCHKRITEDDGRCPGCRKPYDSVPSVGTGIGVRGAGTLAMQLSRSCSMGTRY